MIEKLCKDCHEIIKAYSTTQNRCAKCLIKRQQAKPKKKPKQITQFGKEARRYSVWLQVMARPYLDKMYGRDCAICKVPPPVDEETGEIGYHHVDHIKKRGSHIKLKYTVTNIRYLCNTCHQKVT